MPEFDYPGGTDEKLSQAVLMAIEEAGTSLNGVEPLFKSIDPEALDRLFQPDTDGSVTFEYLGYTIQVSSDGHVQLE